MHFMGTSCWLDLVGVRKAARHPGGWTLSAPCAQRKQLCTQQPGGLLMSISPHKSGI